MNSLNKVTLIGNVGKDPEIRTSGEGKEIVFFSLATSETWKDKLTGEKKEKTEWHRVVVFSDGLVNIIKEYVKKGTKLYLEGSLQTRKWNDASGQEKYTTEVVLTLYNSALILLDSKGAALNQAGYPGVSGNSNLGTTSAATDTQKPTSAANFNHNELDDEIPF